MSDMVSHQVLCGIINRPGRFLLPSNSRIREPLLASFLTMLPFIMGLYGLDCVRY